MINKITFKDEITVGDEKYYHYTLGGKYFADKSVIIDGISYYNAVKIEE